MCNIFGAKKLHELSRFRRSMYDYSTVAGSNPDPNRFRSSNSAAADQPCEQVCPLPTFLE